MTPTAKRLLTPTAILMLAAFTALSGCGQKGPLYLPKEKAHAETAAAAPAQPAADEDAAAKTDSAK